MDYKLLLKKHLKVSNCNISKLEQVLTLKKNESNNIVDLIIYIMGTLNKVLQDKQEKEIKLLSVKRDFSKEVDPSYCYKITFQMGSPKKELLIVFPILNNNNTFLIHGSDYHPIIQMVDKPIVYRMDGNIRFQSNILTIRTVNMNKPNAAVSVSNYVKFKPLLLLFFISIMGLKKFESFLDIKLIVKNRRSNNSIAEEINNKNIYWEKGEKFLKQFNSKRMNLILDQLNLIPNELKRILGEDKYKNVTTDRLFKQEFWINFINKYDDYNNYPYEKLYNSLDILPYIDIFTKEFMNYPTVIEEFLNAFKSDKINDSKDPKNKRFRCLECYFSIYLNYIYSYYLDLKISKKKNFTNDKRIRLDDTISNIDLAVYTYRYNTMMELSENAKITQVGVMGYDRKIFIGSKRDIHENQYGLLCPITTPDRENCGVVLHIAALSDIKDFSDYYKFPNMKNNTKYYSRVKNVENRE